MNKISLIFISTILLCCSVNNDSEISFYISPSGSDTNPGTLEAPFKSIENAKLSIRKLSPEQRKKNITVYLRGGIYNLDKTLVFGLEDSGIEGSKIKYSSYEDEVPIISSGVNVGPWKKLEKNIDRLPEIAKGKVYAVSYTHLTLPTIYSV